MTWAGWKGSPNRFVAKRAMSSSPFCPFSLWIVALVPMHLSVPIVPVRSFSRLIRQATSAPFLPEYVWISSRTRNLRLPLCSFGKSFLSSKRVSRSSSMT